MGKNIIDFSYIVRGDFSPNGLQKIFLSFHPADKKQMETIAEDILAMADCAIYYHTDTFEEKDIDLDDYELKLKEMKLFVVVVTTNYLTNSSLSKSWEYGFAVKNNIPVIPIAVETGLEDFFAAEMNRVEKGLGDIQLLKSQVSDKTEISYKQKLFRDIGAILVDDREKEKIRKAFTKHIFLSYRKKDRKYANELMRTIHSIPEFIDVAVWYDEFITSGEKWNDQIKTALNASDIFLLLVTPFITEPDNYVIREEYPAAREQNKKIVSVRNTKQCSGAPNPTELIRLFPGLKVFVDGDNTEELKEALWELSDNIGIPDPERDYLVGLAFFNGIGVERDNGKAVPLIVASAEKGLPDAVNKLAEMYWNGDGVEINYENSIRWRKKLVEICGAWFIESESTENKLSYLEALKKLIECLYELSSFRDSLVHAKKMETFIMKYTSADEFGKFSAYLSHVYDICSKDSMRLGLNDDAVAYSIKHCDLAKANYESEPTVTNLHSLSVGYFRIGDAYYSGGNFEKAEEWYFKSLDIDKRIYEELQSPFSAYTLSAAFLALGDLFMRNSMYEEADRHYSEAILLRKRILDAETNDNHLKEYGEAVLSLGASSMMTGDIGRAESLFDEAKEIMTELARKYGTIESQHNCSVALNRCGKICEIRGNYKQAMKYYSDSLERRRNILKHIVTAQVFYEYAVTLYLKAGVYLKLYDEASAKDAFGEIVEKLLPILSKDQKGDWHQLFAEASFEWFKLDTYAGKRYLKYAIDGWKWLAEKNPENNQYTKQYELCRRMYRRCYPD